jgi:hypothetical protein
MKERQEVSNEFFFLGMISTTNFFIVNYCQIFFCSIHLVSLFFVQFILLDYSLLLNPIKLINNLNLILFFTYLKTLPRDV